MNSPVLTGTMNCVIGTSSSSEQEWKKQFFVLFAHSSVAKARLDWYNSKTEYEKESLLRKTIYIEEITSVKIDSANAKTHQFQISTLRHTDPFLFRLKSNKELKVWVEKLNKLLDECKQNVPPHTPKGGDSHLGTDVYTNELWSYNEKPEEFPVTVSDTESARICKINNIAAILQLYAHCLALVDDATGSLLYVWPYKYIRRYGKSKSSFTFEAGRRCASGHGVFILFTPEGERIFKEVGDAIKENVSCPPVPDKQLRGDGNNSSGNHYDYCSFKDLNQSSPSKCLPPTSVKQSSPPNRMNNMQLPKNGAENIKDKCSNPGINDHLGQSKPVNAMSAIASEVRRLPSQNTDSLYDEVNLTTLKLSSSATKNADEEVYRELYSVSGKKIA